MIKFSLISTTPCRGREAIRSRTAIGGLPYGDTAVDRLGAAECHQGETPRQLARGDVERQPSRLTTSQILGFKNRDGAMLRY
jgi:hypothetical protein